MADDLGVCDLVSRLYHGSHSLQDYESAEDVRALLAAYDAQAARLAAVEQAVKDNQWMHESHAAERVNDLRPRGYCAVCHDKHPCDTISLLEDVEAGLRGAYPPPWMAAGAAGEGRDGG